MAATRVQLIIKWAGRPRPISTSKCYVSSLLILTSAWLGLFLCGNRKMCVWEARPWFSVRAKLNVRIGNQNVGFRVPGISQKMCWRQAEQPFFFSFLPIFFHIWYTNYRIWQKFGISRRKKARSTCLQPIFLSDSRNPQTIFWIPVPPPNNTGTIVQFRY